MTTTAVLPVKQLAEAKQRLSGLLSSDERNLLFRSMVEDVLVSVEVSPLIDEILVITSDIQLGEMAFNYGASVMQESGRSGLIALMTAAANRLGDSFKDTLVFVPGDVPLLAPEDLEVVLDGFGLSNCKEITIVPADDFGGSNCIACSPPDCIQFCFGENSFRRHLKMAELLEVVPTVAHLPRIGLDIDTPADLMKLAQVLCDGEQDKVTFRYLLDSGIFEREYSELLRLDDK